MNDPDFEKYREDFRKYLAGCTKYELLEIAVKALSSRQTQLLLDDLKLMVNYGQENSKSTNEEFEKIIRGIKP